MRDVWLVAAVLKIPLVLQALNVYKYVILTEKTRTLPRQGLQVLIWNDLTRCQKEPTPTPRKETLPELYASIPSFCHHEQIIIYLATVTDANNKITNTQNDSIKRH